MSLLLRPVYTLMLDLTNHHWPWGGFMSVTPEVTASRFSQWLKGNVVVTLTVLGILLYSMFWIPAIFFYARLGATPTEVGYTYTSVLSGSVLGAIAILGALLIISYYILIIVLSLVVYTVWLAVLLFMLFNPGLGVQDQKLDADQFERKLKIARRIYLRKDVPWTEVERALRRRRELGRLEDPTIAEVSELKDINSKQNYGKVIFSPINAIMYKLRPRRSYLIALFILIIAVTGLLAIIARYQAGQVYEGKIFYGHQVGLFGYHAEEVGVVSTSANPMKSVTELEGGRDIFLGQNAQYAILYQPKLHETERVPVNSIIIYDYPG
jgi:hypothetical protein